MTTIVTHQGYIHGDHLQVVYEGPFMFKSVCDKIFVSKNKQFAYGTIGSSLVEDRSEIEKQIHAILLKSIDAEYNIANRFNEEEYTFPTALILTKDFVVTISRKSNSFTKSSHETIMSIGSGLDIMTAALRYTNDITKSYAIVASIDNVTGSKYSTISTTKLKVLK